MVETCWNPLIGSKYWHVCGTYSHLHSQIHQSKTVCFQWLKVNQTIDAYYAHPQGFHLHHWALATRDGCHAAVCHAGLRSQGRYCEEPPVLWFFVDGNNQSPSIWDGFPTLFHGFPTVFHRFPTIFPRKSVLLVKIEGPGAGKPMENNLFLKGFVQTPYSSPNVQTVDFPCRNLWNYRLVPKQLGRYWGSMDQQKLVLGMNRPSYWGPTILIIYLDTWINGNCTHVFTYVVIVTPIQFHIIPKFRCEVAILTCGVGLMNAENPVDSPWWTCPRAK